MPAKTLVTVAILVMTARVVTADVPAPHAVFVDRPHDITAGIGLNAPTGQLGVEYEYAPVLWLTASLGAGTSSGGPIASSKLRVRTIVGRSAYGIGAFGAFGRATVGHFALFGPGEHEEIERAVWVGGEAYFERRNVNGLIFRFEIGGTKLATMASCTHVDHEGETFFGGYQEEMSAPCTDGEIPNAAVFGTISFGASF